MTRVVVTGGSGLVGQFIVKRFLTEAYDVAVMGRSRPSAEIFARSVGFLPMELDPETDFQPLLKGTNVLIHCAFAHEEGRYRGGEGNDPTGFRRANFDGTLVLFAAAKAAGVQRVIFLSSRAVYGDYPPGTMLHENMEARPDTLYGEVKLAAEQALANMVTEGFRTASVRATGVYGIGVSQKANKWAGLFRDYLAGRPVPARVATEVHGDDLADAVFRIVAQNMYRHNVFNASDVLVDHHDLLDMFGQATGVINPLPPRADAGKVSEMCSDRLRELGWNPGGMAKLRKTVRLMAEAN